MDKFDREELYKSVKRYTRTESRTEGVATSNHDIPPPRMLGVGMTNGYEF